MSMDRSAVKAIVEREIGLLSKAIGVSHWTIGVDYGPCTEKEWAASCLREADYDQASFTIDPQHATDEDSVIASLRHELLHLTLAPFDLYRDVVTQRIPQDGPEARAERRLWRYAVEQTVLGLERMHRNCRALREAESAPPPAPAPTETPE